jgi:hypothetical protein
MACRGSRGIREFLDTGTDFRRLDLPGWLRLGGTAAWAMAKLVKQVVRRPRPADLLPGIRGRGRDATGLGYLSGYSAVAVEAAADLLLADR